MPMPPRTRGTSVAALYTRRPGFDTRLIPEIVRLRSGVYFIVIVSLSPGLLGSSATSKPSMYPSCWRILASATLSFDDGISVRSCIAMFALRIRVSMSAIGSVIVIGPPPSPRCLGHARDLARVRELAQTDPAETELAVHRTRPPAPAAPRIGAHLELGRALLLVDQRLLGHRYPCASRRNGNPSARSNAPPSSSVRAVEQMVMSIPRTVSILS